MTTAADPLSLTLAALAHPARRAMLARLANGEATVTDLARPFDMSQPAVSKHLKVLERAGLVSRGRDAQWRPCRLEAAPLRDVADLAMQYRAMWDESLDRLDAYVQELAAERRAAEAEKHPRTPPKKRKKEPRR